MNAKKTLLFNNDVPWVKKDAPGGLFDVTMGSYDGAEMCESTPLNDTFRRLGLHQ